MENLLDSTIKSVESVVIRIPFHQPVKDFRLGKERITDAQTCLVIQIRDNEGYEGWGEVSAGPTAKHVHPPKLKEIVDTTLTPAVVGYQVGNFALLHKRMDEAIPGYLTAKAALEMACYDLVGRSLGVPVWQLVGGKLHKEVSIIGWIKAPTIEQTRQQARALVDRGIDTLKVKVGYGPQKDEAIILAIREEVGDKIVLRVDANSAYNREDALQSLKLLEPHGIFHYEDPIEEDDLEGMAWLRKQTSVRIMADGFCVSPEHLIQVIRMEAADIVKLSILTNGGIYKTAQMMQIACAAGLPATLGHSYSLTTNTLAELHAAASATNLLPPIESVGLLKTTDDVVQEPLDLSKNKVRIPDRPGLGIDIDPAKLERYRINPDIG
jgi:L-alanine-DL-glutamate epimerase-like enolase superfamily enzyme